jgi:hypothetical protein
MTKIFTAVWRGLALFGLAMVQVLASSWVIVALSLLPLGVGVFLVPDAVMRQRRLGVC